MSQACEPVLILTSFNEAACGVGATVKAWARGLDAYSVVDPRELGSALRVLRRPVHSASPIYFYPTVHGRCSFRALLLLIALAGRGHRTSLHLHEFRRLHPLHRVFVIAALLACRGRVVVSTATEERYVRRWFPRRLVSVVPTPVAGVPIQVPTTRVADSPRVVGIFGIPRVDKGLHKFWHLLEELPPVDVELVGAGWKNITVPVPVATRHRVRALGFVPHEALEQVIGRWALAVAPFSDGATDSKGSLRTPCAYGVPVVTTLSAPADDLTFRPPLLGDFSAAAVLLASSETSRHEQAVYTNLYEARCRRALTLALCGRAPAVAPRVR